MPDTVPIQLEDVMTVIQSDDAWRFSISLRAHHNGPPAVHPAGGNAPEHLVMILEGESLFNDATR